MKNPDRIGIPRLPDAWLFTAYFLSAVLCFVARYLSLNVLSVVFKAIPMALLLLAVSKLAPYDRFIAIGIACSLLGDVLLQTPLMTGGIMAFMAANLFYILAFMKKSRKLSWVRGSVCYLYGGLGVFLLRPFLGALLIPIIVYMLVVMTMLWRAWAQSGQGKPGKKAFIGAACFVLSDSILAYKLFVAKPPLISVFLMAAYWIGQLLIFLSTTRAGSIKEAAGTAVSPPDDEAMEA